MALEWRPRRHRARARHPQGASGHRRPHAQGAGPSGSHRPHRGPDARGRPDGDRSGREDRRVPHHVLLPPAPTGQVRVRRGSRRRQGAGAPMAHDLHRHAVRRSQRRPGGRDRRRGARSTGPGTPARAVLGLAHDADQLPHPLAGGGHRQPARVLRHDRGDSKSSNREIEQLLLPRFRERLADPSTRPAGCRTGGDAGDLLSDAAPGDAETTDATPGRRTDSAIPGTPS